MPNIKSAIKRVKINEKKNLENRSIKSRIATETKKFVALLASDVAKAEEQLKVVVSLMDSAANENIIHKNSADRKKAHFAHLLSVKKSA
ncbi:MAG: 30S ribosomal protein S20 [Clostridia bacterium]